MRAPVLKKNSRSYSFLKFSFFLGATAFGNLGTFWCGVVLTRPDLAGAARGLGGRSSAIESKCRGPWPRGHLLQGALRAQTQTKMGNGPVLRCASISTTTIGSQAALCATFSTNRQPVLLKQKQLRTKAHKWFARHSSGVLPPRSDLRKGGDSSWLASSS